MCKSENDFHTLVEKLYKFIIESSGGGKRLPSDPSVDSMRLFICELRNHFLHAREHGDSKKVKAKYEKVSKIYQNLIGKNVPTENDWEDLSISLLETIRDGLKRAVQVIRVGESSPTYRDNHIFIKGLKPAISRTAKKSGALSDLASIPVFMPHFTWIPPPKIAGMAACVYATSRPTCEGDIDEFGKFVEDLEDKWNKASFLLSTQGSLSWTISEDQTFTYGCGSKNLAKEITKHNRAAIGGILQGYYGEHYDLSLIHISEPTRPY